MKKIRLGPCVTFFPQPTTLVTTRSRDQEVNVMTASWAGIVSKTPPTMAVSMHHQRKSYDNVHETGEFVVNMVPASLALEADYCGVRSGKDTDKLDVTGLDTEPAAIVRPPLISASPLVAECRLMMELPLGDYRLLIGEILEIHATEDAVRGDGSMEAQAFDPLVYLGGIREYWTLGKKIATAYKDGLSFEKQTDFAGQDRGPVL